MKESLKDIFERVWENYWDFFTTPLTDKDQYLTAKGERIEAVSGYASSLKDCVNWVEAVNNDVLGFAAPIHYPPSIIFNKAKRETYRDCVSDFLEDIGRAMKSNGFTHKQLMELKPLTRYLLGYDEPINMIIIEDLSRDEADSECKKMRQQGLTDVCSFPIEIFPNEYLAFGYKPRPERASTPKWIDLLPNILKAKARAVKAFDEAIKAEYIEPQQNGFKWNSIKAELAYFVGKLYGYKYDVSLFDGNTGSSVSYKDMEKLFGVTRLDRALKQVYEATKPQPWRDIIDKWFE